MTIGFFAPLPIALMIPFMVAQSLAMMEAAGKGWQFGKRKISSLSNEEFNKLTPHKILEDALGEYKLMIPSMTQAFDESRLLQTKIIEVMVGYAVQLLSDIQKGLGVATTGSGKTSIKNPFVASFLTPAIIPPIPTEDLIPLTDTSIDTTPSTVTDFEEFQQQTAEDKRKEKLRLEAELRFSKRKQIQLPSLTPKFTKPKEAKEATRKVIVNSIRNVQNQISTLMGYVKNHQQFVAKYKSSIRALEVVIKRSRGSASKGYSNQLIRDKRLLKARQIQIQNLLLRIGTLNRLLAKTKALL